MQQVNKQKQLMTTIDKTLLTANLFDGFWDRWIVHGVEIDDLAKIRSSILTKEQWINSWQNLAIQKHTEAKVLEAMNQNVDAELKYRTAGLYYHLIQWLIPEDSDEKLDWLNKSVMNFHKADQLSEIKTSYDLFEIEGSLYFGRVRIPTNPKGLVIIINPLDSTKEELFSYEMDFVNKGLITVSFDGPGQGQTFTYMGVQGTRCLWERFVDKLIDYATEKFPHYPINLFGTSSGAAWSIYGSCNPKVNKVTAVSPGFLTEDIKLPDYFIERTQFILEEENILPAYDRLTYQSPVLLVHGKIDVMVSDKDIYDLYKYLPEGKRFLEFEDEGHCCNYKLPEIRQIATDWFLENKEETK
ncbi:alpha/beta hydrolase [Sporosarcina sp. 179-K 8C2 HS]|uniref:alpha/beta hydrolase family protein n=1 Tax=Sporosarcina sp. 179-K 8C2 HS TaxID=3142387 RepID=UPI0039A21EB6